MRNINIKIDNIIKDVYLINNKIIYNTKLKKKLFADNIKEINLKNESKLLCNNYIYGNYLKDTITYIIDPYTLRTKSLYSSYQEKTYNLFNNINKLNDEEYINKFNDIYLNKIVKPLLKQDKKLIKKIN